MAIALEPMGIGPGERVAIVEPELGPVPGLVLRRERLRPGPRAGQLPAQRRRDRLTSSSTRERGCCSSTPSSPKSLAGVPVQGADRARRRRRRRALRAGAGTVPPRTPSRQTRTRPARINYTSGTTARPKGVQLTHRNCWLNASIFGWHTARQRPRRPAAHPADVPLQRLGHAVRGDGDGRPPRRAAQGRRRGDPRPRRGRGRHPDVRRAGGRRGDPRRRRAPGRSGRERAGRGDRAHRRGRRAAAVARPSSASRPSSAGSSSRSTGSPRPPRCSRSTGRRRSGTSSIHAERATPARRGPACPASACRSTSTTTARSWPRSNHVFEGYWEQPDATAQALEGGWFHTGDGGYLDGAVRRRSPTARRT